MINHLQDKVALEKRIKAVSHSAVFTGFVVHSLLSNIFMAVRSHAFVDDAIAFFQVIWTGGCIGVDKALLIGKLAAEPGEKITNPVVATLVYWLLRIAISGGIAIIIGTGLFISASKLKNLYCDCCWDWVSITVTSASISFFVYFGDWIQGKISINLILLLVLTQLLYVFVRWLTSTEIF